jgi:uncharacterized protein
MNLKRAILFVLTVVSLFPVFLSLISSYQESQVQSNLELYATNLILRASEIQLAVDRDEKKNSFNFLFGEQTLVNAKEEYQKATEIAEQNLKTLQEKNVNSERLLTSVELEKINRALALEEETLERLEIKLGILKTQLNESQSARELWDEAIALSQENNLPEALTQTVVTLKNLWNDPTQVSTDAEALIKYNLQGWFRYKALEKFYQIQNRLDELASLEQQEKEVALQVIFKLAIVNILPWIGGIIGIGILIYLIVQLFSQKQESLLLSLNNFTWETKWDGEIILQVIVGFFFVSQIVLPGIFYLSRFNLTSLSLRDKAYYVLASYLLLTAGGLSVLYFSIKSYFPLAKDWFNFKWLSNWSLWGFAGYLVAIPLVFVVSLINQFFWNGQGGSNPLLFLALEAQDWVVLGIFFFTASIAAPIFEEIVFRGFLLPSLTRYLPVWGAIVISAFIFAIAHLNLSEIIPLATLGIVLGVVYTRSRNLLSSILLHSLWNSATLVSLFIIGSGAG